MRDIKYRAWCIHKNEWERDRVVLDADGALWHGPIERNKIKLRPDEHIVEFFTGLRDKSGREIYEGDILRMDNQPHNTGAIEFSGNGYWIKDDFANYIPAESMCEIIGNIHENPELKEEI